MTNGWVDIKNTDMMLIMGGNPAENHPCGFKWPIEAKRQRNAKMIVVDPRFTRTAAVADLFLQIRAGADIAFLGGFIRYAIENNRIAREYVANYTNAAYLIKEGFKLPEDGLYSGWDAAAGAYDRSTWSYEDASKAHDLTLEHPRSVFQLLKRHYSRYTPEMVERITGIPRDQFLKAADLFTSIRKDGDMTKAATIIYAVGWTHHSSATQIIRTAAILQLLLGNVGRAGGGVNALRGHANIQGATDMAGVFDILPGYLKMPTPTDTSMKTYVERNTPSGAAPNQWASFNYWSNTGRFMVSYLKSVFGDAARKDNDWGLHWLPKIDRKYSWTEIWDDMYQGSIKGLLAFGMNGVSIGPNTRKNIDALKKTDWLVVCEIYPDETSEFWKAPGTTPEEMKQIQTTVYRLPGASFAEKDGTFVNSARWLQWKNAAVPPPGEAKLDHEILARIFLKVRELYAKEGGAFPEPILNTAWNYTDPESPSLAEVAKEINGRDLITGQQLPGFGLLRDDGTTACGNWIYCGSWTEAGAQMQRRGTEDPSGLGIYPNWGWSWPANRRVLYNRASCDPAGKPWDPSRRQIWWNEQRQLWAGNDVPDFKADSPPKDHMGPFIMNPEGVGRLFAPLNDGPFPEHYEPFESPIANPLHPNQSTNPAARQFHSAADKLATAGQGYDVVCTTYRLTEHYHYWTKNNPMNVQLMPEPFIEIPAELGDALGVRGGEKLKVSSARGHYIAKAMVTRRIKPMVIDGKKVYQIGIPIHWGFRGISEDAGRTALTPVNQLSPAVIDPNAYTPEFKGFLVKVEKV